MKSSTRSRTRAAAASGVVLAAATGLIVACAPDRIEQPSLDGDVSLIAEPESAITVLGRPTPIDFATYERSHQVVHPSVVDLATAWHGHRFWLAITPYPNGDARVENPSIFASDGGERWVVPAGVTNPVATTSRGYLSDPDLIVDPKADELRLYYREVVESHKREGKPARHEADVVYLARSRDGSRWSTPTPVITDKGRYVVSPSVVRRSATDWRLWAVDAGRAGCTAKHTRIVMRTSADGERWTNPRNVSFTQRGYLPWHLDVQFVPQRREYWALVAAYPQGGSCTTTSLFLATSRDGEHWNTYPAPVLSPGAIAEFGTAVYRSTFAFDESGDALTIWLTGSRTVAPREKKHPATLRWSAAIWRTHTSALLARVQTPRTIGAAPDTTPSFLRRLAEENALP